MISKNQMGKTKSPEKQSFSNLVRKINVYDFMIAALTLTAIISVILKGNDALTYLPQIIFIPMLAAIIDLAVLKIKKEQLYFPKSAIITGLIISLIAFPNIHLVALAAALAILSKHIIAWKGRHFFNPAGFGLFIAALLGGFNVWWGAIPLVIVFSYLRTIK